MKTALISFNCDGPDCDESVMSEHEFDTAPREWFSLSTPGNVEWEDEGADFCSFPCLMGWVARRAAVSHGG